MKAILLNRILLVLAFVGLFIAGTLSIEAATGAIVPCGPSGGCAVVANHPSSKLFGTLPVAYVGVLGYLILAALAAIRAFQGVHRTASLVTLGYVVSALGVVASLYLQYISFFVIRATCLWCLSSAALMIVTLIVHALLVQELDVHPEEPDVKPGGPDLPLVAGLPLALGVGLAIMGMQMKREAQASGPKPPANVENVVFIPEKAHIFGQKESPLQIVEFADLLCPACQRTSPQVKAFVAANPGKVCLVYRHYPLQQIHPQAMTAAAISEVAADQGKFWDFTLAVMERQMAPESPNELFEVAKLVGVDATNARKRLSDTKDEAYARIDGDLQAVKQLGITSTPTYFLMSNGKVFDTVGPNDIVAKLNSPEIQAVMNGGKN